METHTETHVRPQRRFTHAGAALTLGLILLASTSHAQAPFDSNRHHLKLQYTNIRTDGPLEVHEGECVPVVDRMWFDCPGTVGTTCTVTVDLSTQYLGLTPGWNAALSASIDGNKSVFHPVPDLAIASDIDRIWTANTVAVSLVATGVKKGNRFLDVCFYLVNSDGTEPGFMHSGVRKLQVTVYKP